MSKKFLLQAFLTSVSSVAMAQQIPLKQLAPIAAGSFLGNNTGSAAVPSALTAGAGSLAAIIQGTAGAGAIVTSSGNPASTGLCLQSTATTSAVGSWGSCGSGGGSSAFSTEVTAPSLGINMTGSTMTGTADVVGTLALHGGGSNTGAALLIEPDANGANGASIVESFYTGGYGPVKINTANAYTWTFGADGTTSLPGKLQQNYTTTTSYPAPPYTALSFYPIGTLFYGSDDNVASITPASKIPTLVDIEDFFGGSSVNDGHSALTAAINMTAAGSTANTYPNFASVYAVATASVDGTANNAGTGGHANLYGVSSVAQLLNNGTTAATSWQGLFPGDFEVVAEAGTSVVNKTVLSLIDNDLDRVQGSAVDTFIWGGAGASAPGMNNFIRLDATLGKYPITAGGSILSSNGGTITNGIDVSGTTFTGCSFKATNFCVDTSGMLWNSVNSTAVPTEDSGWGVTYNFGGGAGEVDEWSLYSAASASFAWKQKSGTSGIGLMVLYPTGSLTLAANFQAQIIYAHLAGATDGDVNIVTGTATQTGYIEWRLPSATAGGGTRLGYIGNDTTNVTLNLAGGAAFDVEGGNLMVGGKLAYSQTAPTIASGFGTSPTINASNGSNTFEIKVGTGGSASTGTLTMPAAPHGWACNATDITTKSTSVFMTKETATTTTSVTFTQYGDTSTATAWAASDMLTVQCQPF